MCSEFGLEPAVEVFDPPPARLARTAFNLLIWQLGATERAKAHEKMVRDARRGR